MNQNKPLTPLNNYEKGVAIWLTGLSGSGKTTISLKGRTGKVVLFI